jgi:hypothetical protein
MMNDDFGRTIPSTPETVDEEGEIPLHNETASAGNPTATRDELWQVQFDPDAAREVAARHLGRLIYSSHEDWSHYVFHENDPKA